MGFLDFDIKEPVHLNWTGKFIAPDENWVHISRALTDFELIVMTEGDLYIADTEGEYVIHQGEYRLMCPTSHQYGYRSSQCNRKYRNINQDNHTLTAILCELYSQLYLSGSKTTMKGEQMQLYTDIVDYISWRIRENIRVSEIAAYFGYNEKYITTFFKKSSGVSLKSYILSRKMELAQALLTDTNLPIAQIGYEIGFSDNHNFSSAFKKVTGQSPSAYRNSYAERMLFHQ